MPGNDKEKRKFVRFLIAIPLKYAALNIEKRNETRTVDISAQGLGLITTEELPLNTPLNICLKIPDNNEEILLEAQVVWTDKLDKSGYSSGLKLNGAQIKPIPLVLRTINSRL